MVQREIFYSETSRYKQKCVERVTVIELFCFMFPFFPGQKKSCRNSQCLFPDMGKKPK